MKKSALGFIAIAVLFAACATNPTARRASVANAAKISQVRIGQTMDEVKMIMGKEGESSERSILSGVERVTWNYLTDYEADMNTTVVFEQGKVVEIKQTPWLGGGTFK